MFDRRDVDPVDRYLYDDFHNHATGKHGTEELKQLARTVGSQEGARNVIEFLVAEDDLVVA